ncbi:MarR family winged helix-turn-helix transcriptional regulator [Streptomyces avicenniae]|uniref:MarR family winged helix-turn-helix transcriptional regulator n=1 Tax=Streptomyces avicenniae TaxID=500153 RepID=UPI000ACBB515|nr:MarR family winged helix-turn-helix transcriptional regulator [Streptomyces avicenniae]
MQDLSELERELMLITRTQALCPTASRSSWALLDRSAYLLMSRVEAQGPMSIGELAEAFGLDTSTVNRQTAAMLRSGLIERHPDPAGGMARKLDLTAEGRRRLVADRERHREVLAESLADWPEEDLRQFVRLLARYNARCETRRGQPWPRRGRLLGELVPDARERAEDGGPAAR